MSYPDYSESGQMGSDTTMSRAPVAILNAECEPNLYTKCAFPGSVTAHSFLVKRRLTHEQ